MPSRTELCEKEHEDVWHSQGQQGRFNISSNQITNVSWAQEEAESKGLFQNMLYTYWTHVPEFGKSLKFDCMFFFFLFLFPKPGSYTSVLGCRAILAAFLFGSRETELHLAASLVLAVPRRGKLFCWTSLQVRSLLREHLTARHWWMSGESNPPAIWQTGRGRGQHKSVPCLSAC